jgi:hypothetical protein
VPSAMLDVDELSGTIVATEGVVLSVGVVSRDNVPNEPRDGERGKALDAGAMYVGVRATCGMGLSEGERLGGREKKFVLLHVLYTSPCAAQARRNRSRASMRAGRRFRSPVR